ncbi:hypothetical protein CHISP_1751 [Chitinispirillum alkaliphilum]|nr:hypothetical protein CHISP_1751 [Chitinispirillum alkaliphilum]
MSCTVEVRLKPGAKNSGLKISEEGRIHIRVTSPPVDGRANDHLVKLLSEMLNLPRSSFIIVRGQQCRNKVIKIEGLSSAQVMEKLVKSGSKQT